MTNLYRPEPQLPSERGADIQLYAAARWSKCSRRIPNKCIKPEVSFNRSGPSNRCWLPIAGWVRAAKRIPIRPLAALSLTNPEKTTNRGGEPSPLSVLWRPGVVGNYFVHPLISDPDVTRLQFLVQKGGYKAVFLPGGGGRPARDLFSST